MTAKWPLMDRFGAPELAKQACPWAVNIGDWRCRLLRRMSPLVGTWRDVRLESGFRGKADYMCSERVFRLLTLNGPPLQPLPLGCRSRCEAQQNRWALSGAPRLRCPGLFAWYPCRRRR